jgi:hypothetical protein
MTRPRERGWPPAFNDGSHACRCGRRAIVFGAKVWRLMHAGVRG